jgi:hypothetical protein
MIPALLDGVRNNLGGTMKDSNLPWNWMKDAVCINNLAVRLFPKIAIDLQQSWGYWTTRGSLTPENR